MVQSTERNSGLVFADHTLVKAEVIIHPLIAAENSRQIERVKQMDTPTSSTKPPYLWKAVEPVFPPAYRRFESSHLQLSRLQERDNLDRSSATTP